MNVLMIGDSIRMFYCEEAQMQLGEEYNCYWPDENCRFAAFALNSLRHWLPQFPVPDIIHFNIGLWDTAILYKEDGCFTEKAKYVSDMVKILRELKKTGAKIIFATTTPVHDDKQYLEGPMPPAHHNNDIVEYNKAVLDVSRKEDIVINDLFSLINPEKERYISEDMIHPNEEGVKLLGKAVADAIKALGKVKNPKVGGATQNLRPTEKTIQ